MIRRGRRNSYRFLRRLLAAAVLAYAAYYAYGRWFVFNPDEILESSVLKEKNFETEVEEVVSPRYKIKAYLYEDKTNPIISLSFIFKNAGWSSEDAGKAGISALLEQMLLSGAGDYNEEDFNEKLENNAITIGFSSGKDDFFGALLTTGENSPVAYDMLKLALSEPRFEEDDIRRVKTRLTEGLKQQQEQPGQILSLAFAKELYGSHPYGRNPLGQAETADKISRRDLAAFMRKNFSRGNLIVGAAGDISPEELGSVLDDIFGVLPESANINFVREADADFSPRSKDIPLTTAQNIAMFAVPGVSRNDADFYPLYVANFIFGGSGLNSRLSQAARENEGLTYSIGTGLALDEKSPTIQGSFSATPENFGRVVQILQREWNDFSKNGATASEVREAKDYLIASYNLRFAAISDIAAIMAYMQRDNLGRDFLQKRNDYVRAVSVEQVNAVAAKYFDNNKLVRVNIGNFMKEFKEQEAR